jgi:enamine deaminase RidA (YjgF/YER057c/UK114 family)
MPGRIDARLAELGIILPAPVAPVANYVPFVVTGDLVVISGQLPMVEGKLGWTGKVGAELDIVAGAQACRQCFINLLAHLHTACGGDLDRVTRVVRLGGFIAGGPTFTKHPAVMNGASDLATEVFGDAGRHARTTVGVPSLPLDAPVEVEGLFRIG